MLIEFLPHMRAGSANRKQRWLAVNHRTVRE
jgi:hypothetical protein